MKHCESCAKSLASLASSVNEHEEIRILVFCCERCAKDHVVWPRLKRGIQLLGEQL
jgi:protein-arginine kinase activator protein McsA